MKEITLGMKHMSLEDLAAIARKGTRVRLSRKSKERLISTRDLVEQWVEEGRTIYGVTTGFGALSDVRISREQTRQLQKNILMSHAAGVGDSLESKMPTPCGALPRFTAPARTPSLMQKGW